MASHLFQEEFYDGETRRIAVFYDYFSDEEEYQNYLRQSAQERGCTISVYFNDTLIFTTKS